MYIDTVIYHTRIICDPHLEPSKFGFPFHLKSNSKCPETPNDRLIELYNSIITSGIEF